MFNNYLKSALRFLKQNKLFAGINALGLSIALAASFLILLFVINELSFDQCHKNRKRVYKVINYYKVFNKTFSGTPYILAHALKDEFPQIRKAVNLRHVRGFKLKLKDEFVNIMDVEATDSDIFDIFTLPLIMGSSHQNLLDDQSSIVLSRDMADKFFRGQNPIGKEILGLVNKEEHIFIVKGVYENIPVNSTFRAECMVNSKWTLAPLNKDFNISDIESRWDMDFWITWVLLSDDCNVKSLENQFIGFEIKNISEKPDSQYSLQNLSDVYLGSDNILNTQIQGNISNLRLFSGIAFLIILVSAINYIILSTAVSSSRSKEIGIRKTYGAGINSIKNQLLSESVLLALLVLPISLVMMWLTMPYAGKLFQTQLHIINSNILVYVSVYLTLTIFIGVVSGIYMSSYLSSLKVLDILKSTVHSGKRRLFFRQSLIVIQLVIFCSFVACTLIIRSQYRYALKIDMGYYNSEILLIDLGNGFSGYSVYINNIKSNPNVIMAAGTMEGLPMQNSGFTMIPNFQYKDQKVEVEAMAIDYNFLKTMGISVIQGRDFSKEYGSDPTQSIILNETAVKQLGIIDPLGKMINDQTIIGIVKDFNLHSIHSKIPPLTIHLTEKYIQQVVVHYKPGTLTSILPMLETEWKKAAPDRRFSYETIEDLIQSLYSSDENLTSIVSIFALFTLLIAALGLFGLTLFVAKSRTKEIGIKKVFGSLEKSIIYSFLFENFILVSLAAIISVPLTLHFMRRWLNNFAFKVNISWWVFIISFAVALVVVLLTVFFHSYKASHLNPVNALKYE